MDKVTMADSTMRKRAGRAAKRKPRAGKSLAEQAYEQIKHRIFVLDYQPGEYLNEAEISKELEIGRTPIHLALSRLQLEGLVDVIPRKGVIVRPVGLNEILEIIDVRTVNEAHAVRLAATFATEADLAKLDEILDRSETIAKKSVDVEAQMLLDQKFHSAICAAAKNTVLAEFLGRLHEKSLRFWFISLKDPRHHLNVRNEHRRILEALRARDPEAAAAAIRDHIESFRKNITRQI